VGQNGDVPTLRYGDLFTEPHFDRSVLLLIDTQVDFLDGGASPIEGTTDQLPQIADLVNAYRAANRPIVHVIRLYEGEDIDLVRRGALWPNGTVVRAGTPGAEIPVELIDRSGFRLDPAVLLAGGFQEVGSREVVMWKPRWSAFFRTPLEDHLVAHGVDTVVIAGCNFPNCPRATAFDASERDYRVVIAMDAVSQATPERLADAESIGALSIPSEQIFQGLASA
jgi:nicotinamidase-related amidase